MTRKDAMVYDFFTGLERRRAVGDATYRRAVAAFGEAGVIDLIGVIGYYTTLAMILNVARTPPPHGAPRLRKLRRRP
jgi:4-carboxymuconolactone decarboxylase